MPNQISQTDTSNQTTTLNATAIIGTVGNDRLTGTTGSDLFIGGTGNDTLNGGSGSDTYVFNKGDGRDTISESGNYIDRVVFNDVNSSEIRLGYTKTELIIHYGDTDSVTISRFNLNQTNYGTWVEEFQFEDRLLTLEQLLAEFPLVAETDNTTFTMPSAFEGGFTMIGGDGESILNAQFTNGGANLSGGKGDDQLYGSAGNDILDGGDDNDLLNGNAGDDILIGGKGNDSLHGGDGSDTYVFNKGDGHDTFLDKGNEGDNDIIVLLGITSGEVSASYNKQSGILAFDLGDGDRITLDDHFTAQMGPKSDTSFEAIVFDDGVLHLHDIVDLRSYDRYGDISLSEIGIFVENENILSAEPTEFIGEKPYIILPTQKEISEIYPPIMFG